MTSLANKTALVTGSARGIGWAIAERYASLDVSEEDFDRLYSINAKGAFFTPSAEGVAQLIQTIRPIKRMGTVADVADAAEYLASNLAGFVSGQHLLISGGAPA